MTVLYPIHTNLFTDKHLTVSSVFCHWFWQFSHQYIWLREKKIVGLRRLLERSPIHLKLSGNLLLISTTCSGRSRPSDKGGSGHPDPEIRGGQSSKKFFSALQALFCSKNKGGPGPPGPLPWIHHWHGRVSRLGQCVFSRLVMDSVKLILL